MTQKRYDHNPFTADMMLPVSSKQVRLSVLGKDDNILVNQNTGEIHGTHVTTYKKADAEQFVKIFTAQISLTFELNAAGIKALNVLIWAVQSRAIEKDLLTLDKFALDEFIEAHKNKEPPIKLSIVTFRRGLSELENAHIIAKHIRKGWYYINPGFCFNGDRIAFTTLIEKTKKTEKMEISKNEAE